MSELGEGGWYSPNRNSTQSLAVGNKKLAELRRAKPHGLFEHCVKHWRQMAGRGINDLQYLGGCGLPLQGLIALGKGLIERPLQLSDGAPKVDYFVIESRGHMLTPSAPIPTRRYFDWHPPPVGRGVRLDHLLAENVKSLESLGLLTG